MRIIFANRYFYPDQSATSRMVSSLAFVLAKEGIETVALTSANYHNRKGETLPSRETIDGVEVHRLKTSGFGRGKLAGRAVDYATFHLNAAKWFALNARKGDICVICTDPPLLSVSAALPIRMRGAKLVNWVMDLFPETAMELGLMRSDAMTGKLAMALRNWSMRQSTLTICPIGGMSKYLKMQGMAADRLSIVHHWADKNEISPVEFGENELRKEWGLNGQFVVGYSGNFGRAHEFETILAAAERLLDRSNIKFLMIGEGQQRNFVEQEIKRRKLTNVVLKPFQPVERLAESLGAANVHIVSLKPALEHCIIPSKFYGVLAAGRPTLFIGDANGEIGTVVREHDCGLSVSPGDADGFAKAIIELANHPMRTTSMGVNARYLMETAYSREYGTAKWLSAVEHLNDAHIEKSMPIFDGSLEAGE